MSLQTSVGVAGQLARSFGLNLAKAGAPLGLHAFSTARGNMQ